MSLLLALALALAFVSASAAELPAGAIAQDVAPSEPWGIRTIISVARGTTPTCRLEFEGALKAWPQLARRCADHTAEITKQLPGLPRALADLVIDERFTVGEKPNLATAPDDQLFVFRAFAQLDIDAAGKLSSCKVSGFGILPPGVPDVCTMVPKNYVPRIASGGIPASFTGYFELAWYIHVDKRLAP